MTKKNYRKFKRSGTEKCPISGYLGPLVEHHINGREVRDADKPWNIAWISPDSHDLIHAGKIVIEGWVSTTDGRQLLWHYAGEDHLLSDARPPTYKKPSPS